MNPSLYAKIPHIILTVLCVITGIISLIVIDSTDPVTQATILNKAIENIADEVILHTTIEDCWTIINGELYDITGYIHMHPGGTSPIEGACGIDATHLFETKGGGNDHSEFAYNLLSQMKVVIRDGSITNSAAGSESLSGTQNNNTNNQEQQTQDCYSTTDIARHNTQNDCWILVNDEVYDVTSYIPMHPGGTVQIINECGKEATNQFMTKGGIATDHSSFAYELLTSMRVSSVCAQNSQDPLPDISAALLSPADNQIFLSGTEEITLTVSTNINADCRWSGSEASYASMKNDFDTTGQKIHTALMSNLNDGDSGRLYIRCIASGDNIMDKSLIARFSVQETIIINDGLTIEEVATHSSSSDCWIIVNDNVYDVTSYMPVHPGGTNVIRNVCGEDATTVFTSRGGTGSHSSFARNLLDDYFIGALGEALPTFTPISATITSPSSSQQFDAGTTGITLSVTTNIAVTCKWSNSNQAYSSMSNTFSNTGTTSHSTSITGLSDGDSRTAYVRCQESVDNVMTSSSSQSFSIRTQQTQTLTTEEVALHSSSSDCWIIVSNNVYDVSTYIPMHPGGQSRITNTCGTDASTPFVTRGGGSSHSNTAYNLLENYFVGALGSPTPVLTPITATITSPSSSQAFDAGTTSVTLSVTTNIAVTCKWSNSNQAYSSMSNTFSNTGTTSHSTSITGLSDGDSRTVYVRCQESVDNVMTSSVSRSFSIRTQQTQTPVNLTVEEVALHSSSSDCWIIVNGFVYDVTSYIPMHPGGQSRITNTCGTDATTPFVTRGGGSSHSNTAYNLLENYNLGALGSSTNQSNGGGNNGGGDGTIPTIEEAIQAAYPGASITEINEEDNGSAEVKFRWNGHRYTARLDAQHNIIRVED